VCPGFIANTVPKERGKTAVIYRDIYIYLQMLGARYGGEFSGGFWSLTDGLCYSSNSLQGRIWKDIKYIDDQ